MPVDLKRNSHEKQGGLLGEPATADEEISDYHYGLEISLEEPELQKFPVTTDMIGKDIQVEGVMRVIGYTEDEHGKSARLQVRALGMKQESSDDTGNRASLLYDQ